MAVIYQLQVYIHTAASRFSQVLLNEETYELQSYELEFE